MIDPAVEGALIALGGAIVGAIAGIVGTWIAARSGRSVANADRRATAYVKSLQSLYYLESFVGDAEDAESPDEEGFATSVKAMQLTRARLTVFARSELRKRISEFGVAFIAFGVRLRQTREPNGKNSTNRSSPWRSDWGRFRRRASSASRMRWSVTYRKPTWTSMRYFGAHG